MYTCLSKGIKNKVPETDLCMFKKKKSSLIKKIWKLTKLSDMAKSDSIVLESKLRSILKGLGEVDLDILLKSIQSNGGIDTDCVLVMANEGRHCNRKNINEPKFTLARAFRFPQLTSDDNLRHLPCCCRHLSVTSYSDCINPYHVSLVVETESPLPPYRESPDRGHISTLPPQCCGYSSTPATSLSSSDDSSYNQSVDNPWCRITYWEHRDRIGRIFHVWSYCVNVFENLPQGDGLCLGLLNSDVVHRTEVSEKVRGTIGNGFQLTRENYCVWLYNRSNIVLFVGAPNIQVQGIDVSQPIVKRLAPGNSIVVYDPNLSEIVNERFKKVYHLEETSKESSGTEISTENNEDIKMQPYCVRVSFGKGWGTNYTRMSITQCPCWVEIYLNYYFC